MKKNAGSASKIQKIKTVVPVENAFDRIGLPIIGIDKKFRSVLLNKKAKSAFGKIAETDTFFSLFEKSNIFLNQCKKALETGSAKKRNVILLKGRKVFEARIFSSSSGLTILMEQPKAETKQLSQLEQASVLSESMGDNFILTDENLKIIDANKAFCKSIGYSKKQVLGRKVTDFDKVLSTKEIKKNYKKADKGHITFDTQNINSRGTTVDVEINLFKIKLDGKYYYASVGRDITTFKEAQLELQNSNKRFEIISNSTQDALWEVNYVTGERWGNDIHQKFYGMKKTDPVPTSKDWESRIHPSFRKFVLTLQEDSIKNQKSNLQCEYWFKRNKNKWVFVYDRTHYVYDGHGNLTLAMGSMLDITELKEAQEQLNSQKNLSESIINALPGIFFLLSKNGSLIRWNKNFETVMGYSFQEVSKMQVDQFFLPDTKLALEEKIDEVYKRGWSEMESTLVTKTGEQKPYYLTGWRTVVESEECVIGTGMDMTEIKKAEKRLKMMEQKIAYQKVQEQKKISRAIISAQERERNHIGRELHDNVNQLLAGTRLYLTMGVKKHPDVSEVVKYPIELLDSGINEIRSLTHQHISPAKELNLKQLAESQVHLLKTASIKCQLSFDLDMDINEDLKTNIYRILQELVNNILKHSKAKSVSISIFYDDCKIKIQTKDDGQGFKTDALRDGIGLSNITNRVDAYDGEINVDSAPGKGCRIEIALPVPDCAESRK